MPGRPGFAQQRGQSEAMPTLPTSLRRAAKLVFASGTGCFSFAQGAAKALVTSSFSQNLISA